MVHQITEAESLCKAVNAMPAQDLTPDDRERQEFRAAFLLAKIGEIYPGSLKSIISMMKEAERAIWPDSKGRDE